MCQYPNSTAPASTETAFGFSMNAVPASTAYTAVPSATETSIPKWNARDFPEIRGSLNEPRTGCARSNGRTGQP